MRSPEKVWVRAFKTGYKQVTLAQQPFDPAPCGYDDAEFTRSDIAQAAVAAALEAAKIAELIAAGDVMANALRGHYIVPGSAGAWQKAVDAMQIGAKT